MKNDVIVLKDVPYGEHERQIIDIYIPKNPKTKNGFVLIVHGGGWSDGDKTIHNPDVEHWSGLGYACGTMNYRFVSENITIFNELDDITSALETVKEKCGEYGFDLKKLLLSGGSAGAHLSLMYAYTRKDTAPVTPVAVCCQCPPVDCSQADFLMGMKGEFENWKYEVLSKCCGVVLNKDNFLNEASQQKLKEMSPVTYLNESCVPTAVSHGICDELVPYKQALLLMDMLDELNIRHDLITFEHSGHALDKDPDSLEQGRKLMEKYIEDYLVD